MKIDVNRVYFDYDGRVRWSRSYVTIKDPLKRRQGFGMNLYLN